MTDKLTVTDGNRKLAVTLRDDSGRLSGELRRMRRNMRVRGAHDPGECRFYAGRIARFVDGLETLA